MFFLYLHSTRAHLANPAPLQCFESSDQGLPILSHSGCWNTKRHFKRRRYTQRSKNFQTASIQSKEPYGGLVCTYYYPDSVHLSGTSRPQEGVASRRNGRTRRSQRTQRGTWDPFVGHLCHRAGVGLQVSFKWKLYWIGLRALL